MKAATTVGHERLAAFLFQSTPPVKAATASPMHEGEEYRISIHAAREGGDAAVYGLNRRTAGFQSTPPVKAATAENLGYDCNQAISIHAAREGGDETGVDEC